MKKLLILIACCALAAGCASESVINALTESEVPRISYRGEDVLSYDEKTMQLAYLPQTCEFRMLKDNMTDYLYVKIEKTPTEIDETVIAEQVIWSSPNDVIMKRKAAFKVLKLEGDTIWLYDQKDDLGLVLKILEAALQNSFLE